MTASKPLDLKTPPTDRFAIASPTGGGFRRGPLGSPSSPSGDLPRREERRIKRNRTPGMGSRRPGIAACRAVFLGG
jgi:hypothetical protein